MDGKRKYVFGAVAIVLGLMLGCLLLEMALRRLPVNEGLQWMPITAENPIPRFKPNRTFTWSRRWDFAQVTRKHSNNYGFLNDADYQRTHGTPLMAIIGDSYVQASQVRNCDAMHGVLQQQVGESGRVYSLGASGAPLATYLAYGAYAEKEFTPDALVFIIIRNDFDESLYEFKGDAGFHYFTFTESGMPELKRIDYAPSLLRRALRNSALVRYLVLNVGLRLRPVKKYFKPTNDNLPHSIGETAAYRSEQRLSGAKKAIDAFLSLLTTQSRLPPQSVLFVIDGMRPHLYNDADLMKAEGSYFDITRTYFMDKAREQGCEVIDMQPAFIAEHKRSGARFESDGKGKYSDGHWNARGHDLVARQIAASRLFRRTFPSASHE